MANLFIQIIIFSLIKLSFQSNNETFVENITSNNNLNVEEDEERYIFQKCNFTDDFIQFVICLLNVTKAEPYLFKYFSENKEMRNTVLLFAHIYLENKGMLFLYPPLEEYLDESNPFLNKTAEIIKIYDENSKCLIDYLINIIENELINKNVDSSIYTMRNISLILNIPGVEELIKSFYDYQGIILEIYKRFLSQSIYSKVYAYLEDKLYPFETELYNFIYDGLKNYNSIDNTTEIIYNFISNHTYFMGNLSNVFKNTTVLNTFAESITFKDEVLNTLKQSILTVPDIVDFFFDVIHYKEMIKVTLILLLDVQSDIYLIKDITNLIEVVNSLKDKFGEKYMNIAKEGIKAITNAKIFGEFISNSFMVKMKKRLNKYNILQFKISESCNYLINNIYFDQVTNIANLRTFYLSKMLLVSSLKKNDFLFYENCLTNKPFPEMEFLNYTVQPVVVVGLVDDLENKAKLRSSTLNEEYNYLFGLCLPYGIYKNQKEGSSIMCSNEDYDNILEQYLNIIHNMSTSKIDSFILLSIHKFETKEYLFCFICIIIVGIPLFIILFLYIYKRCKNKNIANSQIINQLKSEKEAIGKESLIINKAKNSRKKFIQPKWYKKLIKYFDLIKNIQELFNFDLPTTDYNNLHGITYIKGILGMSMIFYIIGQTFLVLNNCPSKVFKPFQFYNLINNYLYIFIFIGLRYSPRIIFSCSGYTLAYKYLCFIDQRDEIYFFKFLFSHSYKYIMLILIALFMRYSLYYIDMIIWRRRRPMLELFRYILSNSDINYIEHLFTFLINYIPDEEFENRQNIIQYFYVPLNEIIFFIFGIILIALGYKYKLRIDFLIIFLTLFLYIGKILLFRFDLLKKKIYSTLYFYLFGYGARMTHPIHNLPYFLIGMYFGLINYSIQRGISLYSKDRSEPFTKILQMKKKFELKKQNEMEEIDEEIYLFKNSKKEDLDKKTSRLYSSIDESETNGNYRTSSISESLNFDISTINNSQKIKDSIDNTNNKENKDDISNERSFSNSEEKNSDDEYSEKIRKMPFLIFPTKILYFHRKKLDQGCLKFIIIIIIIVIILCFHMHYIFIQYYDKNFNDEENKENNKEHLKKISLEKFIPNFGINIIHLLDMELVVFMINWVFFLIYCKRVVNTDIFDFFNNIYWSFFTKSYFSFISISNFVILYILYQSETIIELTLANILLYSVINIIFIIIFDILVYIFYELPLKKMFKDLFLNKQVSNQEYDQNEDEYSQYSLNEEND